VDPFQFTLFIRHGERADRFHDLDSDSDDRVIVPKSQMNDDDPPLCKTGISHAEKTGLYLKKYFEDENMKFDKIIIKCSPFIRTIMTASQVAKQLGIKELLIDSSMGEYLSELIFEENPF
jgi:broad specificity phosphatase PhoE